MILTRTKPPRSWSVIPGLLLFNTRIPLNGLREHIYFGSRMVITIPHSFIILFIFVPITMPFLKFMIRMVLLLLTKPIFSAGLLAFIPICGLIILILIFQMLLMLFLMTFQLSLIRMVLALLGMFLWMRFVLLFRSFLLVSLLDQMVLMQNFTGFSSLIQVIASLKPFVIFLTILLC